MKKIIIIIFCFLSLQFTKAQVQVSLNVDTYPTPELSEWVDRNDLAIVTVTNTNPSLEDTEYRIRIRMLLDGAQVLETDNSTTVLTLGLGTETYLADEIIPYNSIVFNSSSFENSVIQTGLLPAGQYSFCVQLVNLQGEVISTPEEVCMPMIITEYQMPELLDPIANREIDVQFLQSTMFKWSPLAPQPPAEDGIKYTLVVSEIQPGQTPSQAFTVNYPIIEEEILIGTQFNWPLDIETPEEDQNYVWTIKPTTNNDNPYLSTNNGFVNIETFTVKVASNETQSDDATACQCFNNKPISIAKMEAVIDQNTGDDNTNIITIEGANTALNEIMSCMSTFVGDASSEYNDGDPNANFNIENFSGFVTYNWNDGSASTTSNSKQYNASDNTLNLGETVIVTFNINNSNANINCEITEVVEIPQNILNTVNGIENCDCDDAQGARPFVTATQPEPQDYPMKLELNGILQLRDYFWSCNSDWDVSLLKMDIDVVWSENLTETTLNNGPFKHLYTPCDSIPNGIKVIYRVKEKYGTQSEICKLEEVVTVPQIFTDLNQPCSGSGTIENGDSIFAGADDNSGKGEFEIITTSLSEQNGKYNGEGTVYIDWMKANMEVEFNEITVDSIGDLISGEIVAKTHYDAPVYPQDWALNVVATSPWANTVAQNVVNYVQGATGQTIPYNGLTDFVDPVKVPLGVNFPSGDQLAIVDMVFKHDKSEYNLVTAKTTPQSWNNPVQVIGFIAKNISFHPTEIYEPPVERIELIEDVSVGNMNNKITFTFKAPTASNSGCYMEWDETGFTEFGVELESTFTREWLIPIPDDGSSRSTARLSSVGSDWNDLLFTGLLNKSEIVNSNKMTVLADSLSYDMSDIRNPSNISFPDNYEGDISNLFRGFHMKQAEVQLDSSWATNTGGQPKIAINDMIIDNVGVTLHAEATNVVSFPNGEIADLYASIDTVYVDIEASTFREGGMKGRIGLPISSADSIQNPLKYNALLNHPADPNAENYFQLTITPTGPIFTNFFQGEMTLDPTSAIEAKRYEEGKKTFNVNLDGNFSWSNIMLGSINNVDFGLDFQGLGLDYDSDKTSNKLTMDIGNWAFASPQKFLANFPVTVDKVDFEQLPTNGNELLKGKVKIPVVMNLSKKIGATTQLSVTGKIEDKTTTGGKKFTPEFIKASIDSVSLDADLAAVKIKGALGFRNQDPIYGDGFIGTLDANFKAGGIKVGALAEFGNTTYNSSNRYRYWRVEADATFPAPGITFLPGIAFRGFGGGAFNNMKATINTSDNTYSFKPEESGFGFRANAVLATTPKEETFNADVGLLGQFSSSGGLTFIGFNGDFYIGAGFSTRNKAKIKGDVAVNYNFPQKHFNLSANVDVNASPITTPNPANLVLDINGKTNKWYFKFGEPNNINTVKVFGLSLYEYLMFGNDIPYPNGFTSRFRNKYYSKLGSYPGPGNASGGVDSNSETGRGFALGIGFEVEKNDSKNLVFGWKANYDIGVGAEVNLSYMEYLGSCGGYNTVGINGWRAKGGAGIWAKAHVSANGKVFGKNKSFTIADVKGGAWIWGEFPNPYYVSGAIQGTGKFFKINFNFDKSFEKGTKCTNGSASSGAPIAQGDAAADMQQNLIQYVNPSMQYNFPADMPIAVKYGLTPNEVFDVSEQQASGAVEMRTFKMVRTRKLEIKNETTGNWQTVPFITEDQNNIGEYLYTKTSAQSATSSALTPSFGTVLLGSNSGNASSNSSSTLASLPVFNMPMAPMTASSTYAPSLGFSPASPSAAPSQMSNNAILNSGLTPFPAPPGPGGYSNLPPEPDPVVNSLLKDRNYRFTVTATLKEYNGSTWIDAKKNNGQTVTQTVVKSFRTGNMQLMQQSASAPLFMF